MSKAQNSILWIWKFELPFAQFIVWVTFCAGLCQFTFPCVIVQPTKVLQSKIGAFFHTKWPYRMYKEKTANTNEFWENIDLYFSSCWPCLFWSEVTCCGKADSHWELFSLMELFLLVLLNKTKTHPFLAERFFKQNPSFSIKLLILLCLPNHLWYDSSLLIKDVPNKTVPWSYNHIALGPSKDSSFFNQTLPFFSWYNSSFLIKPLFDYKNFSLLFKLFLLIELFLLIKLILSLSHCPPFKTTLITLNFSFILERFSTTLPYASKSFLLKRVLFNPHVSFDITLPLKKSCLFSIKLSLFNHFLF